ncbi:terpenoid cyclases/Protein prenyltransferase [Punctularia strigosozonata HHB-11173 SS5]|uniref:terpenoid cyclases/Protein prenyltransferase n=1 Tax=Punctularia strigosozonata (strain HHB-11173) TaxID=741275 RepID=UPI0004418400|nr:terpenoid cyclases/Protein prenyltransferase [Punctularia strigosozonata HHB-11173 SS5]EIN06882.1 terpenoid cyclases/Protein prenyltransferase [Punctularia strigosozonata HHB-11173 SS5]
MGHQDALDREEMIQFVLSCWDEDAGAFGAHPSHDAHILATLSGIQILVIQDALDRLSPERTERVVQFILDRQTPAGVFSGDSFGETDTRFTHCSVLSLALLGRLSELDKPYPSTSESHPETRKAKILDYTRKCRNFDGAFGSKIDAESHAAQVFVCTGTLAVLGALNDPSCLDRDTCAWWLSERQLPNGGLNGRPEKLEDVCYSFWVLSSLSILGKLSWIDADKLTSFILSSQDPEQGGIADRPDNMVDVFHTVFGVAGLSLVGYPGLVDLDPVYCMPAAVIEKKGLRTGWKALPRKQK